MWYSYYKCDDCYWKTHQAEASCKSDEVCELFQPLDLVPVCAGCASQKECKKPNDARSCESYVCKPRIDSFVRQSATFVNGIKTDVLVRADKTQPVSFVIKIGKRGLLVQSKGDEFEISPIMFENRQIVRHDVKDGCYFPKVQGDVKTVTIGERLLSTVRVIPRLEEIPVLTASESKETSIDLLPIMKEVERRKKKENRPIEKVILDVVQDYSNRNNLKPDETMFLVKAIGQEVVRGEDND